MILSCIGWCALLKKQINRKTKGENIQNDKTYWEKSQQLFTFVNDMKAVVSLGMQDN